MDVQLRELIPFLRDRNPEVRQIALSHLIQQTPPGSPHRNIFFDGLGGGLLSKKEKEVDVIRDLKLLCRDQLSIAHDAFRALVNLSDSPLLVTSLSELPFLTFIVSYIIHPDSILADLASMLLSNLTASSAACSTVLSLKISIIPTPSSSNLINPFYATQSRCATSPAPTPYPSGTPQDVPALPLLVDAFAHAAGPLTESGESGAGADPAKRTRKADLHFLASVFANLSVAPAGRNFFLEPHPTRILDPASELEFPLAKIVPFTEHKDKIRRGGVTSTIKNCAFHAPGHKAILSPDTDKVSVPPSEVKAPGIDALPYILLPLAGPEEFDLDAQDTLPPALQFLPPTKTREPDPTLRLTHVETLLLLSHTRWGRDALRERGVYEVVRVCHEEEKVDKISEHIERLVMLLKGEEPADSGALDEDSGVGVGEGLIELGGGGNAGVRGAALVGASDVAALGDVELEEGGEDDRIEEV